MCGRYYSKRQKQEIAEHFHAKKMYEAPSAPDYNIAPTTFQPVIRLDNDTHEPEMTLMRWGLVPFFAESMKEFKGFSTFNARAESISTSAIWREPFKRRRCIVPTDGFYEWKKLKDTASSPRQPFAISLRSGEPFAFAGIWDAWKEPKRSPQQVDVWLQSFSIITTEANEIMAPIHNRMPVILHQRDWKRWLDREVTEQPPVDLLRPFDSELMQLAPCNQMVGSVRNNGPEMLEYPLRQSRFRG